MITINHHYQPSGNSCGPTCLFMVSNYLKNEDNISIVSISKACGTDWIVGTPPDKMIKGLEFLNLNYHHYLQPEKPFKLLKKIIDNGNIPIIRTITKEVPHWIIVNGYNDNHYNVLDPWLGVISYDIGELNKIWLQRNYEFFNIIINEDCTRDS